MSVDVLQQKKQEVAQSMFEDFKHELNFFQSTVLSFFDKKITQAITSDEQFGTSLEDAKPKMNFLEKMLVTLSPSTAEKVFLFIKENQEKIVQAKTVEELDMLKKGIIVPLAIKPENQPAVIPQQVNPTPNQIPNTSGEQNKDKKEIPSTEQEKGNKNIIIGVGTGAGLGLTTKAIGQIDKLQTAKRLESTAKITAPKDFIKKFEDLAEGLKKEGLNPKLTTYQKKMIDKSIKEFQSISKDINPETFSAVKMLEKLDKKLPNSVLKSIDPSDGTKLAKLIADEPDFFTNIATKNVDEIQTFFKTKQITNINDEVINALKIMKTPEELQGTVHILTNLKGLKALRRGMRGVILLDVMFTGFDIWTLNEGLDAAAFAAKVNELRAATAKEHAVVQFGASLALTAVSIIITCSTVGSAGGPIGAAVGAILGVAGFAASQAIDVYYDAVEFYQQNKEDFQKQYRTEIKQAIIQSAGSEERNLNLNSRMYASAKKAGTSRAEYYLVPFGILTSNKAKLTTTADARKALIRQEEYEQPQYHLIKQGFASGKTEAEFLQTLPVDQQAKCKQQQLALNAVIDQRMTYIQDYMYEKKGTPQYASFVAAMKNNLGIKAIEKILTDSKVYSQMGQTGAEQYVTGAQNIDEYKKLFGEKLKAESPDGFATLQKMWATQPYMVLELYQGIQNTESMFQTSRASPEYDKKDQVATMQKNLSLIKRYYQYKSLSLPLEEQKNMEISFRALDARMLESILISGDFASVGALSRTADQVKNYFIQDLAQDRRDTQVESSDKVGQNIIYRIAKEIHGYQGHNIMPELIDFFREDKGSALGLYYSDGWKINNDGAIDKSIDLHDLEKMSAAEIITTRVNPSRQNKFLNALDPITIGKVGTFGSVGLLLPGSLFGLTDDAAWLDTKADAGDLDQKMNLEYLKRFTKIVYEEKSYSTPEIQKMVEKAIVDYIQKYSKPVVDGTAAQQQGYIEMPYYLIMAAKKAKIGDIGKFLFKYQNNQIVACTSRSYINEPLTFTQTKTSIIKEYVNLGTQVDYHQAMPYIDYVDQAKNKFEKLITFDDNELDLPAEYIKKYKGMIKEWNDFKFGLLNIDPKIAASKLERDYQKYHDQFENMYTAMLSKISQFSLSNDLDSAQHLQEVESRSAQLDAITIQNGLITGDTKLLSPFQSTVLYKALKLWKPRNMDILTMAKSANPDLQSKAIRAVKQIITSILEAQVLQLDGQGNITSIIAGENKIIGGPDYDPAKIESQVTQRVTARVLVNGNTANYFIPPPLSAPSIDQSKATIQPVT